MGLLDWFIQKPPAAMPEETFVPIVGLPPAELAVAFAALNSLAANIDRRILRVEVMGEGRLIVSTGYSTGPLASRTNVVRLERQADGWKMIGVETYLS